MVTVDNLVAKLCTAVLQENPDGEVKEWRLLGQEQDGTLLFAWIESSRNSTPKTHIGLYRYEENELKKIHSCGEAVNAIQASINADRTLLGYVVKELNEDGSFTYKPFLVYLVDNSICDLEIERSNQIMVQFLYHKQSVLNEDTSEKFLLLVHGECILQYKVKLNGELNLRDFIVDTIVRVFVWAQWDNFLQTLYYIHYRKPIKSLVEGEEQENGAFKTSPMLSGLQFHDDLPHESILNIPLNLPHLSTLSSCGLYEDDTVPLRIHDCSLDLIVVSDSDGIVCICHHYLYQPVQPTEKLADDADVPVHFAYSVTVLHHSCVIHCVIPGIPWNKAKAMRPLFKLYDGHMLVFIPGICTHLLDIGFTHEPCCHIVTTANIPGLNLEQICLTPLYKLGTYSVLNLPTLDVVDLFLPTSQLIETFKSTTTLQNKLSILHYLLVHRGEIDTAVELLTHQVEQTSIHLPQMFREFLIGSAYASVQRNLPAEAAQLINLLPITTQPTGCDVELTINGKSMTISQDVLWNASMMLLSPQQRIVPYRVDVWVRLWEKLVKNAKGKQKFKPSQVVEKLLVSLVCYQPEALSRCSTPMSPAGGLSLSSCNLPKDFASIKYPLESLPFHEIESCTASKQEHIISVNLRELSMHLLKQSAENKVTRFQWQLQTPMHVNAVATRYIAAQLEQSRYLCQILCKVSTADAQYDEKGFAFIDQLNEEMRYVLFTTLEQYYLAAESIAFPLPQGFMSFFTFLGYRTLKFNMFLQYVDRHVFELQIDVMKIIMGDIEDSKTGIERKLTLLGLLPRMRAKRLLNQWNHPVSLMIRAREHAMNILSGVEGASSRQHGIQKTNNYQLGLAAFPSGDRLSPLDTFLDLLTAKANLNELDFGLLIEATVTSTEDFL